MSVRTSIDYEPDPPAPPYEPERLSSDPAYTPMEAWLQQMGKKDFRPQQFRPKKFHRRPRLHLVPEPEPESAPESSSSAVSAEPPQLEARPLWQRFRLSVSEFRQQRHDRRLCNSGRAALVNGLTSVTKARQKFEDVGEVPDVDDYLSCLEFEVRRIRALKEDR